jgi:hypothetical protein
MTELLVREIERELMDWLSVGVWVDPDAKMSSGLEHGGTSIGSLDSIREIERTHQQLVWEINDDAFVRYVVHCCARYHDVVSFSEYCLLALIEVKGLTSILLGKDVTGAGSPSKRLTYILRPHISRPSHNSLFDSALGIDTPPVTDQGTDFDSVGGTDISVTDLEIESAADVESDFAFSEVDSDVELEGVPPPLPRHVPLTAIAESESSSPRMPAVVLLTDSDVEHDADVEHSDLGSEIAADDLASSVASLELDPRSDRLLSPRRRSRPWERQRRGHSSPSGSPARRNPVRRLPRVEPPVIRDGKLSFYDYLFA